MVFALPCCCALSNRERFHSRICCLQHHIMGVQSFTQPSRYCWRKCDKLSYKGITLSKRNDKSGIFVPVTFVFTLLYYIRQQYPLLLTRLDFLRVKVPPLMSVVWSANASDTLQPANKQMPNSALSRGVTSPSVNNFLNSLCDNTLPCPLPETFITLAHTSFSQITRYTGFV